MAAGLVALMLALACTVLTLSAAHASSSMTGMTGMAEMSGGTVATAEPDGSTAGGPRETVATLCPDACATAVCSLAAGAATVTVLALLLGSRRHTFLGRVARPRRTAPREGTWWSQRLWTVLPLSGPGLLRV